MIGQDIQELVEIIDLNKTKTPRIETFIRFKMDDKNILLAQSVRIGQNVVLTGNVSIGKDTSLWHNVILRGDVAPISIGECCNIQDNTVLHGQLNQWNVNLGNNVSIGHSCILHGCELADNSFIGMGTIVMNGAYIGSDVMVAAGSLISQGTRFEDPGVLIMGRPGKIVRKLKDSELQMIRETPARYTQYATQWLPLATLRNSR